MDPEIRILDLVHSGEVVHSGKVNIDDPFHIEKVHCFLS